MGDQKEQEQTKGLNFGQAIHALKQGKRVCREGWNGRGMFIFMQVPSEISMAIVPNMQSLPQAVKDEFARRFASTFASTVDQPVGVDPAEFASIRYRNQLAIVYPNNTIYGWVASPSDVLENDWQILD